MTPARPTEMNSRKVNDMLPQRPAFCHPFATRLPPACHTPATRLPAPQIRAATTPRVRP